MICIASRTGVIDGLEPVGAAGDDPERDPDEEREADRREHQRQRLHARLPQADERERGERAEHDRGCAHAAEAQHGETSRRPLRRASVSQRRKRVNQVTRLSTKVANPLKRLKNALWCSAERWSSEPGLEGVELRREAVPDERRSATGSRSCSPVDEHHRADDDRDLDDLAAPPRPVLDARRGRRRPSHVGAATDSALGSFAGDRLQRRDPVDDADDLAVARPRRPASRVAGEHRHGILDRRRHLDPRAVDVLARLRGRA